MAQKIVLTCDKCGNDGQVSTYSIGMNGATPYDVDLCERCAAPVRDLKEIGRQSTAGLLSQQARGALREPELRSKIYDPEELDKLEEEYRRKHSKK